MMLHTDWVIRKPDQIEVRGNQRLSATIVRSMLSLSYPQSLLTLDPQALTIQLKTSAHISQALVTRTLFPPRLVVQVTERHPVAIVTPTPLDNQLFAKPGQRSSLPASVGLIDEQGNFMPLRDYTLSQQALNNLKLRVIGMRPSQYGDWQILYPLIRNSAVTVSVIDWRNPANLILTTNLGTVYVGSYGSNFPEQLKSLEQMRILINQVNPSQIAYIDVRNPESPILELKKASSSQGRSP
jgi:cell division protein FtsQ